MKNIGIVGAGTMGAGIAHVAAIAGCNVVLCDKSSDVLSQAITRIASDLRTSVTKGKLPQVTAEIAGNNIHTSLAFDDFSSCEFILEAAIEDFGVKQDILKRLEKIVSTDAVIATNTSSYSVTRLASVATHPHRIVGMHFFNPPHLMKLVEVVRGRRTSESVLHRTIEIARPLGKIPVAAADTPGFIVNRIARPFYGEALRLLGEGVASIEEIDAIVKQEGGFRMGPFELMDLIGIDVNLAVTQSIFDQTFGEPRYRPHIIQQSMVNAGDLGRKTKKGFYRYDS